MLLGMSTSYWFQASKSKIVRIALSERDSSRWGIWLNNQLLDDASGSAEEAALRANQKKFGEQNAVELFDGVSVPSDIAFWRPSPPEMPAPASQTIARDCRDRHRRPGSTQL